MNIEKVIAISGKPGLYNLISQTKSGFIAKNLDDGKKSSIPASYNVSLLSNVAIYTHTEEVPLREVFKKIYEKENGKECISHKSSESELRAYMQEVLPEYDESRVYYSDLKKLFQWYNILLKNDLLTPQENEETTNEEA
ncbi:hypothetical protein EQP59_03965 [Ornithobacterium rhinotracheale]|uniref:Uncharacterized protein n=1 Tax=Ornithobacterium rhinotracheale TaxID=28251 RepID=A0A3R5Y318_ORNRH|nr:DUF5606 domain-containing protein [Ornithobacterium rhinotracheale]MRI64091.1 hypothetical protein [Ornithobacterium rhinotracheale]QAR30565.1 hypothetical protein EQP59_03965 [Ornithobacterium rhinotracheale]